MRAIERVLLVCGIVAVGGGIVVMAAPGIAALVGGMPSLLWVLGLLALVQTARTASDFWNAPRSSADLPNAHEGNGATILGEAFDETLDQCGRRGPIGRRARKQSTRYVRRAAVDLLVAKTGESSDEVERRLREEIWKDDSITATLFAEDYSLSWTDRIRSLLGRETIFQRRIRRAIELLEQSLEGDDE